MNIRDDVKLAHVDCDADKEFCESNGVQGTENWITTEIIFFHRILSSFESNVLWCVIIIKTGLTVFLYPLGKERVLFNGVKSEEGLSKFLIKNLGDVILVNEVKLRLWKITIKIWSTYLGKLVGSTAEIGCIERLDRRNIQRSCCCRKALCQILCSLVWPLPGKIDNHSFGFVQYFTFRLHFCSVWNQPGTNWPTRWNTIHRFRFRVSIAHNIVQFAKISKWKVTQHSCGSLTAKRLRNTADPVQSKLSSNSSKSALKSRKSKKARKRLKWKKLESFNWPAIVSAMASKKAPQSLNSTLLVSQTHFFRSTIIKLNGVFFTLKRVRTLQAYGSNLGWIGNEIHW